jgi:hypothetical protein
LYMLCILVGYLLIKNNKPSKSGPLVNIYSTLYRKTYSFFQRTYNVCRSYAPLFGLSLEPDKKYNLMKYSKTYTHLSQVWTRQQFDNSLYIINLYIL